MSNDEQPFIKRPHGGWAAIVNGDNVHIVPVNDLMRHEPVDCACVPWVDLVEQDENYDGPDVWMHVHSSLDGRERYERQPGTLTGTHEHTEEDPHG